MLKVFSLSQKKEFNAILGLILGDQNIPYPPLVPPSGEREQRASKERRDRPERGQSDQRETKYIRERTE